MFVDPNDDSIDFWQVAMVWLSSWFALTLRFSLVNFPLRPLHQVVPTVEWDSDMRKIKPGEVFVRYFSDLQM